MSLPRSFRGPRLAAMVVVLLAAVAALTAGPAGRAEAAGYQTFKNQHTGKCLTYYDVARTWACEPEPNSGLQDWFVYRPTSSYVKLMPWWYADEGCLLAGTSVNAQLTFGSCASGRSQWTIHRWGDGTIRFRSRSNGLCIASTTTYPNVATMARCDESTSQSWY